MIAHPGAYNGIPGLYVGPWSDPGVYRQKWRLASYQVLSFPAAPEEEGMLFIPSVVSAGKINLIDQLLYRGSPLPYTEREDFCRSLMLLQDEQRQLIAKYPSLDLQAGMPA